MIIKQIETTIAALVLALSVAIAGFAVWTISSKIHNSKLAEIEKKHAEQIGQYERNIGAIKAKAQEETAAAMARMKDAQDALARLDQQKSEELAHAQAENDALKRDVADGSRRVRILKTSLAGCDASASTAGRDSTSRSVGDAAAVELTADFGSNVLDLRQGIIDDQAKLTYLQSYVKDVVKQCKRT